MVSDLRSETSGSPVPGSSPATSYVQRWALCSNRPVNVSGFVERVEVVKRNLKWPTASPAVLWIVNVIWKKTEIEKKLRLIESWYWTLDNKKFGAWYDFTLLLLFDHWNGSKKHFKFGYFGVLCNLSYF